MYSGGVVGTARALSFPEINFPVREVRGRETRPGSAFFAILGSEMYIEGEGGKSVRGKGRKRRGPDDSRKIREADRSQESKERVASVVWLRGTLLLREREQRTRRACVGNVELSRSLFRSPHLFFAERNRLGLFQTELLTRDTAGEGWRSLREGERRGGSRGGWGRKGEMRRSL